MSFGTFVGTCTCPLIMGYTSNHQGQQMTPINCPHPCNVYDIDGSGSRYTSVCSGSDGGSMHRQYFGRYYLHLVNTGSTPAW